MLFIAALPALWRKKIDNFKTRCHKRENGVAKALITVYFQKAFKEFIWKRKRISQFSTEIKLMKLKLILQMTKYLSSFKRLTSRTAEREESISKTFCVARTEKLAPVKSLTIGKIVVRDEERR